MVKKKKNVKSARGYSTTSIPKKAAEGPKKAAKPIKQQNEPISVENSTASAVSSTVEAPTSTATATSVEIPSEKDKLLRDLGDCSLEIGSKLPGDFERAGRTLNGLPVLTLRADTESALRRLVGWEDSCQASDVYDTLASDETSFKLYPGRLLELNRVYSRCLALGFAAGDVERALLALPAARRADISVVLDWLSTRLPLDSLPTGFSDKFTDFAPTQAESAAAVEFVAARSQLSSESPEPVSTPSARSGDSEPDRSYVDIHERRAHSAVDASNSPLTERAKQWTLQFDTILSDDDDADVLDPMLNLRTGIQDTRTNFERNLERDLASCDDDQCRYDMLGVLFEELRRQARDQSSGIDKRQLGLQIAAVRKKIAELERTGAAEAPSSAAAKDVVSYGNSTDINQGCSLEQRHDAAAALDEDETAFDVFAVSDTSGDESSSEVTGLSPVAKGMKFAVPWSTTGKWSGAWPKDLLDEERRRQEGQASAAPKYFVQDPKGDASELSRVTISRRSGEDVSVVLLCSDIFGSVGPADSVATWAVVRALAESSGSGRQQVRSQEIKQLVQHLLATKGIYELWKSKSNVSGRLAPGFRELWNWWSARDEQHRADEEQKRNSRRVEFCIGLVDREESIVGRGIARENSTPKLEHEPTVQDKILPRRRIRDQRKDAWSSAQLEAEFARRQATIDCELEQQRLALPAFQLRHTICDVTSRTNISQHESGRVVIISGETGSGKSTQVPQFILRDSILRQQGAETNILCTQPRRISATSIASRVASELGDPKNDRDSQLVGFQIRLEAQRGKNTRLLYCTTGVVLRRLQVDPELQGVSHLIIDEVHERSVESDFLLLLCKTQLLPRRPDLVIVLMSATADAEKFANYFAMRQDNVPRQLTIPGRTFPVEAFFLEDVFQATRYVVEPDSEFALSADEQQRLRAEMQGGQDGSGRVISAAKALKHVDEARGQYFDASDLEGASDRSLGSDLHADMAAMRMYERVVSNPTAYSMSTLRSMVRVDASRLNYELIEMLLVHIDSDPKFASTPGAVLIFLPGLAEIQRLYELLISRKEFADSKRFVIIPLHSALVGADSQHSPHADLLFQDLLAKPNEQRRKIVLATNIAETGVTIPDIVFVIDSGRQRSMRYDAGRRLSTMKDEWIARANAKQRAGRAGRVRAGVCFRLYSRRMFESWPTHLPPDILRANLSELCLQCLVSGVSSDPGALLGQSLDPPSQASIQGALELLEHAGAIEDNIEAILDDPTLKATPGQGAGIWHVTPLGVCLAGLPVDPFLGRMLIYGSLLGCLDPILTIAAGLSASRPPFTAPLDKRDEARSAKASLARGGPRLPSLLHVDRQAPQNYAVAYGPRPLESDLLTLVRAYCEWESAGARSRKAQQDLCRRYFLSGSALAQMHDIRNDFRQQLQSIGFDCGVRASEKSSSAALIKAVAAAGVFPNVARVDLESMQKDFSRNAVRVVVRNATKADEVCSIHPSSVVFSTDSAVAKGSGGLSLIAAKRFRWLAFHSRTQTHKVFLRDVSQVTALPLVLFGGPVVVQHEHGTLSVSVRSSSAAGSPEGTTDDSDTGTFASARHARYIESMRTLIIMRCVPRSAVLLREVRKRFNSILLASIESGRVGSVEQEFVRALVALIEECEPHMPQQ